MKKCNKPPKGWQCSRQPGHKGPCAAHQDSESIHPDVQLLVIAGFLWLLVFCVAGVLHLIKLIFNV